MITTVILKWVMINKIIKILIKIVAIIKAITEISYYIAKIFGFSKNCVLHKRDETPH